MQAEFDSILSCVIQYWYYSGEYSKALRFMMDEKLSWKVRVLPYMVLLLALALWELLAIRHMYPESSFPSPLLVAAGFREEIQSNRLQNDLIASLFRVSIGFTLSVSIGIPIGLILGLTLGARTAFMPVINFFRNLSPLAWIPFAILWFGIGDKPAVFLIFVSSVFPIIIGTVAAVANIPSVYFRAAKEYGLSGVSLLTKVTLPAIMPQVITNLRVTAGLAWLVVVAAEMIAGKDGLGWAIWDDRNGLRLDLIVVEMIVIGSIGVVIDRLILRLTRIPSVRWGYER